MRCDTGGGPDGGGSPVRDPRQDSAHGEDPTKNKLYNPAEQQPHRLTDFSFLDSFSSLYSLVSVV